MRRTGVLLITALALLALVTGCQRNYSGLRLTIAAGSTDGVYYPLGGALAGAWAGELGMPRPGVLQTQGAVENVKLLRSGTAQVAFADADALGDFDSGPRPVRALARLYDDYIQVVVPAGSAAWHMSDLRGRRLSIGAPQSQTVVVANRLLGAAGLNTDLTTVQLDLNQSIAALRAGTIDAFVWSGGLPTDGISGLSATMPLRLLDLSDVLPTMERSFPVYETATVPTTTYGIAGPSITTLVVPNFLLVTTAMPDDEAQALVNGLFKAQAALVEANRAALSIDVRSAIYTSPVPLHDGALAYYRSTKT